MVPKEGVEPTHPKGYYVLNVARLPFRHFGPFYSRPDYPARSPVPNTPNWWAVEDLNLGPLACEASALTAELTAPAIGAGQTTSAAVQGEVVRVLSRSGNDRVRTCDLALMKRPLCH